jgi:hypothetical protein
MGNYYISLRISPKRMLERILAIGILFGLVIRDVLGQARFDHAIMMCGSLLAVIYLFGNWWTNKPKETNARTIIVSILYGIASSSLAFALIFKLLYLSGSSEITILSFLFVGIAIGADLLTSIQRSKIMNAWTIWRFAILSTVVVILFFVSEDYRISVTYRNYPEFLEYYRNNKDKQPFDVIQDNYFNNAEDEERIEI